MTVTFAGLVTTRVAQEDRLKANTKDNKNTKVLIVLKFRFTIRPCKFQKV